MKRTILHCDINHCYAQMEEREDVRLRNIAMAVGGNEENRHGIILAKNDMAKTYGIKTGESLREAYEKCPHLYIIPPDYERYARVAQNVKDIYRRYSERMESFGLDEAWLDISGSINLFGSAMDIAKRIQKEVYEEEGLTISIGLSWNKIFAKLGSDQDKCMGLYEITKENYKQTVWPLPVGELLYVGHKTKEKLAYFGVKTIGDLANLPYKFIEQRFQKMGVVIWNFANGMDDSEVAQFDEGDVVKSVGNSITTPKDITSMEEAKLVLYVLCESICARLREQELCGKTVAICVRDVGLSSFTRQCKMEKSSCLCDEIMPYVMKLMQDHYDFSLPLRSIGIRVTSLVERKREVQLSLFESAPQDERLFALDAVVDKIRNRFGFTKIKRCSLLLDQELTSFDPKGDHVIFPVSYF